ncbi:alpha/beta fold hydrolase [Ensifer adhaerens]|uniref:alpha/beta fold hydrolase n=1 Tax=Ensifer adhaerens TaxID=106592 RepID=UPI0023584A4C|nr:alpha/beta hydrolase [Ensifer adhaerens]
MLDRRLAYRDFGSGTPLLLCVRFRGTMDSWDPAFLDGLASNGFRVIVFDYSGLGASTGNRTYDPASLARDAGDLLTALNIEKAVVGGWSLGGIAAQILFATSPQRVSHLVLIGSTPPGQLVKSGEALFYELAKRENDLEDIVALFFEPRSAASRLAAEQSQRRIAERTTDLSPTIPVEWAGTQLGDAPRNPMFPADAVLGALKTTKIPVIHIGGDHDIIFPVENWSALAGQLPTLRVVTFPETGHGPHQQYPQESADYIAAFTRNSK